MRRLTLLCSLFTLCLLLLAACARTGNQTTTAAPTVHIQAAPQVLAGYTPVHVIFQHASISSSMTTFKKDSPYFFIIVNNDSVEHQFTISPPVLMGGHVLRLPTALATVDHIEPGTIRTLRFTFNYAVAKGKLEFSDRSGNPCLPGKHLAITVTKSPYQGM